MFDMGPLFSAAADACLRVGAMPIFGHHTKREAAKKKEAIGLEDLAYSGASEFARQWLLVNRRDKYEPGTGLHRLWLSVGGSMGQSGLWSVDIDEGQLDEHFDGRRWDVVIQTAAETRQMEDEHQDATKAKREAEKVKKAETRLLVALDDIDKEQQGAGQKKVRDLARLSGRDMTCAVRDLVKNGVLEEVRVPVKIGTGKKTTKMCDGIRRKRKGGDLSTPSGLSGEHRDYKDSPDA
jgi:hypothetical protein